MPAQPAPDPFADLPTDQREVLTKVLEILERRGSGTILLGVQCGKAVQIEMAEKFRLR